MIPVSPHYSYPKDNNSRMSGGFPHSDIHGSKPIPGSPWLNAGYHVLHRLLLPRHPPNALFALDLIRKEQGSFPCQKHVHSHAMTRRSSRSVVLDLEQYRLRGRTPGLPLLGRPAILMLYLSERCQNLVRLDGQTHPVGLAIEPDLVEPIGIEPMTPCLQSRCSPS